MNKRLGIFGIVLAIVSGCGSISGNTQTEKNERERYLSINASQNTGEKVMNTNVDHILIGEKNYFYTWEPKGKLKVSYQFYTVQNYNNKDYYFIKCMITGIPGAYLAAGDSNYKQKYKGTEITASLSSGTSSVTRDSYGPARTDDLNIFEVNVNAFGEASYSWTLEDVDTDVSLTSAGACWNFALKKGAKKTSCSVLPGIVFACPYNKDNITVTTSVGYTLDSWNTGKEIVLIDKEFLCSPDAVLEK